MAYNPYIEGLTHKLPFRRTESNQMSSKYVTDTYFDNSGVIRWKSNDRVPPKDILEFWRHVGFCFDLPGSLATQKIEDDKFLAAYRKNYKGLSAEDLAEARANFEPGTIIVDVITGHKTKI